LTLYQDICRVDIQTDNVSKLHIDMTLRLTIKSLIVKDIQREKVYMIRICIPKYFKKNIWAYLNN